MTIHRSLKLKNALSRSRNVFRRVERLEILQREGKRESDESVYGLPKVRTRLKLIAKKKGKPEEAADDKAKGAGKGAGKGAAKGKK